MIERFLRPISMKWACEALKDRNIAIQFPFVNLFAVIAPFHGFGLDETFVDGIAKCLAQESVFSQPFERLAKGGGQQFGAMALPLAFVAQEQAFIHSWR